MENKIQYDDDENLYRVKITNRINFGFWKGCGIIMIALLLAQLSLPPSMIDYANPYSFVALVIIIWLLNLLLKPLLIIVTLPFILFTLGIGVVFVDSLVIWVAGAIPGIEFRSYWAALWAGCLVEALSWIFAIAEAKKVFKSKKLSENKDDSIDV